MQFTARKSNISPNHKLRNIQDLIYCRIGKLDIEAIKLGPLYSQIVERYQVELEEIRKLYTDNKESPGLLRNMPKTSSAISWARHLHRLISGPIFEFERLWILTPLVGKSLTF